MSCMCSTKLWVAGGALVHVSAGEVWLPAWVYLTGIWAPSANDVEVSRIAGGAAPGAGACWAEIAATINDPTNAAVAKRENFISCLLSVAGLTRPALRTCTQRHGGATMPRQAGRIT